MVRKIRDFRELEQMLHQQNTSDGGLPKNTYGGSITLCYKTHWTLRRDGQSRLWVLPFDHCCYFFPYYLSKEAELFATMIFQAKCRQIEVRLQHKQEEYEYVSEDFLRKRSVLYKPAWESDKKIVRSLKDCVAAACLHESVQEKKFVETYTHNISLPAYYDRHPALQDYPQDRVLPYGFIVTCYAGESIQTKPSWIIEFYRNKINAQALADEYIQGPRKIEYCQEAVYMRYSTEYVMKPMKPYYDRLYCILPVYSAVSVLDKIADIRRSDPNRLDFRLAHWTDHLPHFDLFYFLEQQLLSRKA